MNNTNLPLTNFNTRQAIDVVWNCLMMAREDCISFDSNGPNDQQWDEICTAMGWIQEALDCEEVVDS